MNNSIEVNNLSKSFGKFKAVDNISFNVKEGEIFGFLGANGAGKSTTIRMLTGIIEPTSGDALVGGYSIKNEPDKVKSKIGYMSQRFSLYDDLTVEENIVFYGGIYGLKNHKLDERKQFVMEAAGLNKLTNAKTRSLPGGIKQRLALGTAVIHEPEIVFLDEPTSGVDPISRRNFWELINSLSDQGITIIVTTHYLEEAEYCNNIILIDGGKLIASGNSTYLKEKYLKYPIYNIECSRPIESMELLEEKDWVDEISLFGNNIHVIVNDESIKTEQIKKILEENKSEVKDIHKIIPTLEDVFIHLLHKDKK